MEWETIDNFHQRAKVFGGWLVKAYEDDYGYALTSDGYDIFRQTGGLSVAMAFVPDKNHEWEIKIKDKK